MVVITPITIAQLMAGYAPLRQDPTRAFEGAIVFPFMLSDPQERQSFSRSWETSGPVSRELVAVTLRNQRQLHVPARS